MTRNRPRDRRQSGKTKQSGVNVTRMMLFGGIALILVGAVVVALLLSANSDETAGPAAWSTAGFTGGPRLAVDQTAIDDGDVPYGHKVNAVFRLKNVGDQALDLGTAKVETLDGC